MPIPVTAEQRALADALRSWAQRIGISVPTLIKMERGDAGVSAGIYATALWMIGRTGALAELAAPETDRGALEADVRAAISSRGVRGPRPDAKSRRGL